MARVPKMGRYRARLYLLFFFLLSTLAVVAWVVLQAQENQANQIERLEATYQENLLLNELMLALVNAETGERGFVITGDEVFLQPYHGAVARMESILAELRAITVGDKAAVGRREAVEAAVVEVFLQLDRVIAINRAEGREAAGEVIRSQAVKREMDRARQLIRDWMGVEQDQLDALNRQVDQAAVLTRWAIVVGFCLSGLFLVLALGLIHRETRQREKALMALTGSRDDLSRALETQNSLLQGRERLRHFTEALQTCRNLNEAQQVLALELPQIVGVAAGALALQNASRVYLEVVHSWGSPAGRSLSVFDPGECYSLRRGRPVWCLDPQRELCCIHLQTPVTTPAVCYPLTAHNQILGSLVLWGENLPALDQEQRDLLALAAETFSVVLSNLMLDETLRFQAVMDPLTGLYNRRHMEVSLERELARAKRSGDPLAVVMADVDHFKSYNDNHGHDAADTVLKAVGELLANGVRTEDVACRYGGEEFLLVLPGIDRAAAIDRVESIRREMEQLRPRFHREMLPGVTLSLGVAFYPRHGESAETLIRAADQALYTAKRRGRNRVEVAAGNESQGGEDKTGDTDTPH